MSELPATVALLGGGVIGGGWAARFLLNGVDVRVYDPGLDHSRLAETLSNARRALARLTLTPLPPEGTLTVVDSAEEAVRGAEFVQESAPERLDVKRRLLADASRAAAPETVFCSSTSGIRPTLLQAEMERPERLAVGHPFNPVYLLPLVEVCGGRRTTPETVARATAVYRSLGMRPLVLRAEVDGFLADRLLEALWREALWLIHDEVATVEELDDAISYGPGLRWAIMGTFLTYRLAGGDAGMRHFIEQFGPALAAPWTRLVDVPELTPEFVERLIAQSDAQVGTRTVAELERTRDDCLVALLQGLRAQGVGAGETVAEWERALLDAAAPAQLDGRAPLRLLAREIPPSWIDYNGHVHESRYLQLFADATDALLRALGVDAHYVEQGGSYFTVETHLSHLRELVAGDRIEVLTQVLGADEKRLHLFHSIVRHGAAGRAASPASGSGGSPSAPGDCFATAEQMLVHVHTAEGTVRPASGEVRERVEALAAGHAKLPRPERAGRRIGLG